MRQKIYNIAFPILLMIYSLLLINQGVTVTDTGYNYSNFVNYDSLDSMWKFSTFLSTSIGSVLTHFPLGHTMLGLNFYTGLVKASIAVIVYFVCVHYFGLKPWIAFISELTALGYCWCPTAVLYNYLSYFLFTAGAILLCIAANKQSILWYGLAGLCLGMNVLVRLPNLAEIGLILAVWYFCYISKTGIRSAIKITGVCVVGYILGIGSILTYISYKYGIREYINGIYEMISVSDEVSGYSLGEMIRGDIYTYRINMKWLTISLLFVFVGIICYFVLNKKSNRLKRRSYICANFLLLFIYNKMGMFKFTYYNYDAIENVGIFFLILAGVLGLYVLFFGGSNHSLRIHAATMEIIILVTPLGSNNYLLSAINNLFWVTPFVFQCCYEWWLIRPQKEENSGRVISLEPMRITFTFLIVFIILQGVLFGTQFVFNDGINGEERTAKITDIPSLSGMYTQSENATALRGLNNFLIENDLKEKAVILYNDIPGLAFYLDLQPALSSVWSDLDSYTRIKFEQELMTISTNLSENEKPLIILGAELDTNIPKQNILLKFIEDNDYNLLYSNDLYYLYW